MESISFPMAGKKNEEKKEGEKKVTVLRFFECGIL